MDKTLPPTEREKFDEWWQSGADIKPRPLQELFRISELLALLPGTYYMDPPDGGDVPVLEQLRRMSEDAAKWRATQAAEPVPETPSAAVRTLLWLGYTYTEGAELWRPPLGPKPDFDLLDAKDARIAELEAALRGLLALNEGDLRGDDDVDVCKEIEVASAALSASPQPAPATGPKCHDKTPCPDPKQCEIEGRCLRAPATQEPAPELSDTEIDAIAKATDPVCDSALSYDYRRTIWDRAFARALIDADRAKR